MTDHTKNKNVQKVQNELLFFGLNSQIIEFSESTRTAQDAANAIGCEVAHIVKSLIFCTQDTNQPVLVLTSGINRVNEKMIEQLIGEKIKKADADFTREVTGFAIGGVAPLGHAQHIKTIIDEDLLQYDTLWAAAGTPNTVFSLQSSDLIKITQGIVAKVC